MQKKFFIPNNLIILQLQRKNKHNIFSLSNKSWTLILSSFLGKFNNIQWQILL